METNPFEPELILTSDGSHTLKLKGYDEQYHSLNGALQESEHVFLKSGPCSLSQIPDPLFVFEVGLGTGLNALVTARWAVENKLRVYYEACEPYPVSKTILDQLNYPVVAGGNSGKNLFERIHAAGPVKYENLHDRFFIRCFYQQVQETELIPSRYHVVYFDAFGPDTQPQMWEQQVFEKLFAALRPGGILVTYCVKGDVRRAMKSAGFTVEKIPGAAGKREMSRAIKPL